MIALLTTHPELLVALLGLTTSGGLVLRALPAVLDRLARAREDAAKAELVDAETQRSALASAHARAIAAEERARVAESRAAALAVELASRHRAEMTGRAPALPAERKKP